METKVSNFWRTKLLLSITKFDGYGVFGVDGAPLSLVTHFFVKVC